MNRRSIVLMVFILAFAMVATAADDPFTGSWQEVSVFTMTPNESGLTFVNLLNPKPVVMSYGKDFVSDRGYAVLIGNTVRVDDYTMKTIYRQNGKLALTVIHTISPDGKHSTRAQEYANFGQKRILEDERVGSVPAGDVFVGTWKLVRPKYIRTVKVDGNNFEWSSSVEGEVTTKNTQLQASVRFRPGAKGKLDGKEYKEFDVGGRQTTKRMRRIDNNTIEIIEKVPPLDLAEDFAANMSPNDLAKSRAGFDRKQLWQVKGGILRVTTTDQPKDGTQTQPSVTEYERVK